MKTERITHTLHGSNGDLVAQIEEWQGVDGPYLAFRYRGGTWEAAHGVRLEWAMRATLNRHAGYLHEGRRRTRAERERAAFSARAIREIAWALASWATQTNWVEVVPVAWEVDHG